MMATLKSNVFKSFKEANKFVDRHQGDGVGLEVGQIFQFEYYHSKKITDLLLLFPY